LQRCVSRRCGRGRARAARSAARGGCGGFGSGSRVEPVSRGAVGGSAVGVRAPTAPSRAIRAAPGAGKGLGVAFDGFGSLERRRTGVRAPYPLPQVRAAVARRAWGRGVRQAPWLLQVVWLRRRVHRAAKLPELSGRVAGRLRPPRRSLSAVQGARSGVGRGRLSRRARPTRRRVRTRNLTRLHGPAACRRAWRDPSPT
jgi:hypothetical protein